MSDYKVTELNEILATSVAADDLALLIDVSAAEDKKITIEELSKAVGANMPSDSLNGDIIIDGTIDGDKILDGSITAGKLAPDSVNRTHIIAEEVSGSETSRGKVHIEPGSIGAADIANGSITPDKLYNPGGPILITDNEIDPNANIQVSKLEPAPPNYVLAGPATGVNVGPVEIRPLVPLDLPVATDFEVGAVSIPFGSGLTVDVDGAVNHEANTFGQNLGYIEYNDTGHIINARAIDASIDIPPATETSLGVVQIGDGISVDLAGVISLKPATTFTLGGVIVGDDFQVDFAGTLSLKPSGVTPGEYTKVTVNEKGIVTLGTSLSADDLIGGEIDIDMLPDNSVGSVKLTDYSTCYIQEGNPGPADYLGMFWFQPSTAQLRVYARGSAGDIWLLVGGGPLQAQNLRWGGTFNATTDTVTSVTGIGTSEGIIANAPFPAPSDLLAGLYLLCETGGNNCSQPNLSGETFGAGDWAVCMGAAGGWVKIDVSSGSGGGGGGGAQRLNDLLDVTIGGASGPFGTTPAIALAQEQILKYDSGDGQWKNTNIVNGGTF